MASAKKCTTVVGVFEDRLQADKAVSELMKAGFRQDQIGVAMRHTDGASLDTSSDKEETYAEEGGLGGMLAGLGLGALAGMGVLAGVIPVVGPAIAAGTLGVILSNAAAGAGIAGLIGALVGAGIPENEAEYYHGEFEAGRTIVTVMANGRADEASAIMRRHGAYDMSTRGSTASTERAACHTTTGTGAATCATPAHSAREADTLQAKEERLHAEKRPVETGEVKLRKEVHTETKTLEVPVEREEIVIERTPVHGRAATSGINADNLREGEEIRIPVREEKVSVSKDAVVTEEVKVGKRVVHDTEHVSGQVRKEEIKVEQTGNVDVKTRGPNKGKGHV